MKGEYIGASVEGGKICAPILRKKVKLTQGETSFLHVNTLGYHEIYINGRKVGEDVLTPAVSHLSKRSLIVTYDITPYLREGENDLLIWLGQGWYKTTTFGAAYEGPLVKAELDVLRMVNGKSLRRQTDHGTDVKVAIRIQVLGVLCSLEVRGWMEGFFREIFQHML